MIRWIDAPTLTYLLSRLPDPERYRGPKYIKIFVPGDLPLNASPIEGKTTGSIDCDSAYFSLVIISGRQQWALRCVLGEP